MPTNTDFKHESMQDMDTILKYLDALRDGFASGAISFANRSHELILSPQGMVKFQVEAKKHGGRRKLQLKFSWREEEDQYPDDEPLEIESR